MKKLTTSANPTLATLADSFVDDRRESGLSIKTVTWYRDTLRREFLPWAGREKITDPADLAGRVGQYTTYLLDRTPPLARATVRGYVRAVRVFLAWAGRDINHEDGGGGAVVGGSPRLPKAEKHPDIDVLSRDEIASMEAKAQTERDKLIVRVLADTGIRLGELLRLAAGDLREGRKGQFFLVVHGKGSKDRLVPCKPELYRRLKAYINGRGAETQEPVFVALRRGVTGTFLPITKSGVEQAIRALGVEAGLDKRIYPHLFRHSFATDWLRKGGSILLLQQILGHSDLSQIQAVYSHLDTGDAYDAMLGVLGGR